MKDNIFVIKHQITNKVFKDHRELLALGLLNCIWHYVMEYRFQRLTDESTSCN